jgi:hypothetical protein
MFEKGIEHEKRYLALLNNVPKTGDKNGRQKRETKKGDTR